MNQDHDGLLRNRRVGEEIQLDFRILQGLITDFVYKKSNPIITLKDTQVSRSMIPRNQREIDNSEKERPKFPTAINAIKDTPLEGCRLTAASFVVGLGS